ncbi:MAG: RNA 2',3'-cyclic phosphodiesterase [Thermoplasmata archaeon]
MRCFIGIKVPVNDKIINFQNNLKRNFKIKLVEPQNMHITLKFLGELDDKNLEKIKKAMEKLEFKRFIVQLLGAGAFPRETNARVIWIGLVSNELNELGDTVSTILRDYSDEKFSPHLTLGRLKIPANVSGFLSNYRKIDFGSITVNSFEIYKSTLTPQGPIYEKIEGFLSK